MSAPSPIVGIDLGTTNSAIGVVRKGRVEVLSNALGDALTPSVVALDERSGALIVGRTAKDVFAAHADLGAALFKRGMGSDLAYPVAGARHGAVELSARLLRSLRADAERHLGQRVERAVVTVPAYFDDAQRYATLKAGELAGLDVVRILNEPTAAAIAHGVQDRGTDGTILVVDLGGGTFDVCVMDRFEGALEVRSVAGESMLGGEDFTRRLAALALSRCTVPFERAEVVDPAAMGRLIRRAELLKRALTTAVCGSLHVPAFAGLTAEVRDVQITRAEFEEVAAPLLERLRGPCRAAVRGARLRRTDIEDVILVGGATRMPAVRRLARELFDREPMEGVDPDLAVVHGAALQGALIDDAAGVGDFVVTDVASHSLGTEIVKDFGAREIGGFFSPVIHRNTTIPTSAVGSFCTRVADQTRMDFPIYEGESRYVKDNRLIGQLVVTGIPRGPPGQEVDARFTYDLNGMLEVEVTIRATGAKVARVFTRDARHVSDEALRAARSRLARIKQDPREAPRVRDAIARAEVLLQDLAAADRRRVDHALDALEAALADRDQKGEAAALGHLLALCKRFDHGERW